MKRQNMEKQKIDDKEEHDKSTEEDEKARVGRQIRNDTVENENEVTWETEREKGEKKMQ